MHDNHLKGRYRLFIVFFDGFPKTNQVSISITSARITLWGAIHAQSKEKQTFISQNNVTPMDAGPH